MHEVVGVDEVGRGSWAGPLLVVAARAKWTLPAGLADSKLLTRMQRQNLYHEIIKTCQLGEGWVQPEEVDKFGLTRAMKLGVSRAFMELGVLLDETIIMDGLINYCPQEFNNVQTIAKADRTHPIVSAASIYAKVKRDLHMTRLAQLYPNYHFDKHVGYGTKLHLDMLKTHGVSAVHRITYRPVKALLS